MIDLVDWTELTLILYIFARLSGFILFNPIFGRSGIPTIFRSGLVLVLTVFVFSAINVPTELSIPSTVLGLSLQLVLEMALGFLMGMVMNIFFFVPQLSGMIIDTQMGMTMGQTYDPGSSATMSVSGVLLNTLMMMLFFAGYGHHTLMRIIVTSDQIVPFGSAVLSNKALNAMIELFIECFLLGIKLSLPVLAAELIGQIGMGILMKVIPQINVFAINIELKVIIGMLLLVLLMSPFSEYILKLEVQMLDTIGNILGLASG